MTNNKLHYVTERPSLAIKICASLMLLGGVYVSLTYPVISAIFILMGLLPFTMHKCVEFKLYEGVYREGYCIVGRALGKEEPFSGLDFIFLKKNRYTQITHGEVAEVVSRNISFDGYLNLCDGTKILVVQESDKEQALKKLSAIAQDFQAEIKDLT
ncbi:hypothetical protein [Pontibacter cellulosilyticus]|uniref:Uncharacterized protein n=1 Tax=Pontibacter cellulosilyticus TaxID=1720253 RepID=A0A923N5V5_9BACT|nr:hypothetical protein [Pontibacter cellulosilyticus]MBC5992734.1 hypothetical protein [Pontibacter cellulosilyticus]